MTRRILGDSTSTPAAPGSVKIHSYSELYFFVETIFLRFLKEEELRSMKSRLLHEQGAFFQSSIELMDFYLKQESPPHLLYKLQEKVNQVYGKLRALHFKDSLKSEDVWGLQKSIELQNLLYGSFLALQSSGFLERDKTYIDNKKNFFSAMNSLREKIIKALEEKNPVEIRNFLSPLLDQASKQANEAFQHVKSFPDKVSFRRDYGFMKEFFEKACKDLYPLKEEKTQLLFEETFISYLHVIYLLLSDLLCDQKKVEDQKVGEDFLLVSDLLCDQKAQNPCYAWGEKLSQDFDEAVEKVVKILRATRIRMQSPLINPLRSLIPARKAQMDLQAYKDLFSSEELMKWDDKLSEKIQKLAKNIKILEENIKTSPSQIEEEIFEEIKLETETVNRYAKAISQEIQSRRGVFQEMKTNTEAKLSTRIMEIGRKACVVS
jgi:hypothetical protein